MFVLSFGMAISRIAEILANIDALAQKKVALENELVDIQPEENGGGLSDDMRRRKKLLNAQILAVQTQISLYQNFLEFWRQVLQATLQILKSFNELLRV